MVQNVFRGVVSALTWVALALLVVGWLPALALVRLLDRDPARYTTGRVFRALGAAMTRVNPAWTVERTGPLPPDPRRPFVVVSNHQSNADIPLISTLPWEMKWVAKAALFRIPVVGWMMRLAGDIPVERGDAQSRARVIAQARQALARRCSVMFMPEGTRSRDGRVRAFQDGAFRLAVEAGVPLLPLAIDGTADTLPKHGWVFGQARCRLHVFPPVPTEGLTAADVPALREHVRGLVVAQVAAWRGVDAAAMDGTAEPARTGEEPSNSPAPSGAAGTAG